MSTIGEVLYAADCLKPGVMAMDFIEQLFGFSPDAGSGAFEVLLFALPIGGIVYLGIRRHQRRLEQPRRD